MNKSRQIVEEISLYYNKLNWFQRLFFPRELAKVLQKAEQQGFTTPVCIRFYQECFANTWFIQCWFYKPLRNLFASALAHVFKNETTRDLLQGEFAEAYFTVIAEETSPHALDVMCSNLVLLKEVGLDKEKPLTETFIVEVGKIKRPITHEIKDLLGLIIKLDLLQGEAVKDVIVSLIELPSYFLGKLASGLLHLSENPSLQEHLQNLYSGRLLQMLIDHKEPHNLVDFFNELHSGKMLGKLRNSILNRAINHSQLGDLVSSLKALNEKSPEAFVEPVLVHLCQHPHPLRIHRALSTLYLNHLFTGNYIVLCTNNFSISTILATTLIWLKKENLLGGDQEVAILKAIQEHEEPADFIHAIFQLANMMDPSDFSADLLADLVNCPLTPEIASQLNALACEEGFHVSTKLAELILSELTKQTSIHRIERAIDCLGVLNNRELLKTESAEHYIRASLKYIAKNDSLTLAVDMLGSLGLIATQFARSNFDNLIKYEVLRCQEIRGLILNAAKCGHPLTQSNFEMLITICATNNNSSSQKELLMNYLQDALPLTNTNHANGSNHNPSFFINSDANHLNSQRSEDQVELSTI